MDDYYKNELAKVNTNGEYAAKLHIINTLTLDRKMNYIDLNHESAQALADFLAERFGVYASHK